jgi:succinate-semialdehyde dehydrogenase/glutarate-semialdehyde dehydrogenase
MAYQSINPFTGKTFHSASTITDSELDSKLERAGKAFREWSKSDPGERASVLTRAADILEIDAEKHGAIITSEMGKPITQSIAEVKKCAWLCRYFAENGEVFLQSQSMTSSAKESFVWFEPLGIIFAVMPWNFPYWQVFRFIVPNLTAGNTGLLKHASNVPQCAQAMEDLFLDAGLPEGCFQNLYIDYSQTATVVRNRFVQGATLTGSNYAGNKLAELAGQNGKKTVLELGGSDPYIVFDSADLDHAIKTGIMARFQNNGQSCIAAKRFFIQDTIYDQFLDGFTAAVEEIKCGDPMDPDTVIGPVARKDLLIELEEQLEKMVKAGGKIITGGKRFKPDSIILEPTLITGLDHSADIIQEELFGPVLPIFKFNDEKTVIELANDTPFGLGASVWTNDMDQARRVAHGIQTGTVSINGMVKSDPGLPFGGVKASGYGRELSEIGLREFVNIKTVSFF